MLWRRSGAAAIAAAAAALSGRFFLISRRGGPGCFCFGGALFSGCPPRARSKAAPVAVRPSRRRMLTTIIAVTAVAAARLFHFGEDLQAGFRQTKPR